MAFLYIDDPIFGGPGNAARLQNALTHAELNDKVVVVPPGIHVVNPASVQTTKNHTRPWGITSLDGGILQCVNSNPVIQISAIHIARYLELIANVQGPGGGIVLTSFTPGGGGGGGGGSGFLFNTNAHLTIQGVTGVGLRIIGNVFETAFYGSIRDCTSHGVWMTNDGIGIVSALDFVGMGVADNGGYGYLASNVDPSNFNAPRNFRIFGGRISGNDGPGVGWKNGAEAIGCIDTTFEDNCKTAPNPQAHIISNGAQFHGCTFRKDAASGSQATAGAGGTLVQSNPSTFINCTTFDSITPIPLFVYTGTNNTHMALWGCSGNIHRQGGSPWTAHHCRGINVANGAPLNLAGISTG